MQYLNLGAVSGSLCANVKMSHFSLARRRLRRNASGSGTGSSSTSSSSWIAAMRSHLPVVITLLPCTWTEGTYKVLPLTRTSNGRACSGPATASDSTASGDSEAYSEVFLCVVVMAMTTTQRKTSEYASLSPEAVLSDAVAGPEQARPFEVRVKGKTLYVPSVQVQGRRVITTGRWLRIGAIHDEELVEEEPVPDPEAFLRSLRRARLKCDIFTFAQRLPETAPRFKYCMEWDNYAVIPITTLADWEKRVASDVRKALRRARR